MNNSNIKEALKKIIKEFDCDYDGKDFIFQMLEEAYDELEKVIIPKTVLNQC